MEIADRPLRVRKDIERLKKAKEQAGLRTNAILLGILKRLNQTDPGWDVEPTSRFYVTVFVNQYDKIFFNHATTEITPGAILTEIGVRAVRILAEEVEKRKERRAQKANRKNESKLGGVPVPTEKRLAWK